MQYFQNHVFWDIKRQNRSSGLTPSRADVQTKKAQTINNSPLRGGHAPEPIDMPYGVLSRVPDVIKHAKFCVNRLRGFSVATPRKVPFPILFWTTITTVLHYRVDCDSLNISSWYLKMDKYDARKFFVSQLKFGFIHIRSFARTPTMYVRHSNFVNSVCEQISSQRP